MNAASIILDFADQLETVGNLLLIFAAYKWADGYRLVSVRLSVGTFKVRKKDLELATLTAIVSETFFAGAWLPANVRAELIALTTPKAKDVVVFEENREGHEDPPLNN